MAKTLPVSAFKRIEVIEHRTLSLSQMKAQVSFTKHLFSIYCLCVCKHLPLQLFQNHWVKCQPNMAERKSWEGGRMCGLKFVQTKDHIFLKGEIRVKIH